jgi:dihydrofolate reductase
VLESIVEVGGFLLGRRTYEIFAAYWPKAPEEEQVIAQPLNPKPKYVAATTLTDPLELQNSRVLEGDVDEAVAALKQEDGADVHVIGSAELVRRLIEYGLIDEFRLMIDPVMLGVGKAIFRDDGSLRPLRLVHGEVTTTGAILATFRPRPGNSLITGVGTNVGLGWFARSNRCAKGARHGQADLLGDHVARRLRSGQERQL